ncbi:MAG: hypothetical protein Q7K43_02885 [Candidatus Woesearchaeota archaeon]|nr:hypothetical protein [Candidatus Woesearchaeota archaeon]
MPEKDISNKTVVVVLVLVMLISVLSLAISMNAVKRIGSMAQVANEAVAQSQIKTPNTEIPKPAPIVKGTAQVTITVVPNPNEKLQEVKTQ